MIKAEIIADSISPSGCRITSWILEYPRFIHAEFMTARVFSRNAASSRAIPIGKMIKQVIDNPASPVWWGKNQKGMKAREELTGWRKSLSKFAWYKSRYLACGLAWTMCKIGMHKQLANRVLEPWFNIRVMLTATEYENYFALRAHPDAQNEFRTLAELMLEKYNTSEPVSLNPGEWHIPFGDNMDEDRIEQITALGMFDNPPANKVFTRIKIATARAARVSYYNFEGKDDYFKDIKTCDDLFGSTPKHLSPAEHCVQCMEEDKFYGNLRGFKPYRKFFPDENLGDSRVIKKKWKPKDGTNQNS